MSEKEEIYYREVKVPFKILKFTKQDIKTRIETPLNFYQKYIILILKNGVSAKDEMYLAKELSEMLNIKGAIVLNFIEELQRLGVLYYENGIYSLTNNTVFNNSDSNEKIMVANVKEGIDKLDYIYMLETGNLLSRTLLEKNNISTGVLSEITSDIDDIKQDIIKKNRIGKDIAEDSLNKVLSSNFDFLDSDFENIEKSIIHLPVKIEYIYDREKECGIYSDSAIDIENELINKYVSSKDIALKIKTDYENDSKKPDYIILEEQLEKERIEVEKLKQEEKVLNKIEKEQERYNDIIKKLTLEITQADSVIKDLKNQINEAKKESKDYQKQEEVYNKIVSDNLSLKKELEEKKNDLAINKKSIENKQNEIKDIQNKIAEEHKKIILDEFDKKLEVFKNKIDGIDPILYPKLVEECMDLYMTLLSLSKKINNDTKDLHKEWRNLYGSYTIFIKVVLCYLLGLKPELFDSIKSIIDNFTATDLANKYGFSISSSRNLRVMESVSDTGRHKSDSKKRVEENSKRHKNDVEIFKNYIKSSKETRKETLICIFEIFLRGNFNADDYKRINDMCLVEAEKTGSV